MCVYIVFIPSLMCAGLCVCVFIHFFPCSYNSLTLSLSFVYNEWLHISFLYVNVHIMSSNSFLLPILLPAFFLCLYTKAGPGTTVDESQNEHGKLRGEERTVYVLHAPLRVSVFVYDQRRVCYYCCSCWSFLLQGQWSATLYLSLSHSTAGAAVCDKRVSAAADADQASLPGLGIQGSKYKLAQFGKHMHTHSHACGPSLLTYANTCSYAMRDTWVVVCGSHFLFLWHYI